MYWSKIKREYKVLITLVLLSVIVYLPSYKTGMVTDFLGWIGRYEKGDFGDVLSCFGYNGNHQFFHLFNYSFYKVFGLSKLAWSSLFCLGHAVNAYLVFRFVELFQKTVSDKIQSFISYLTAFLFLISVYQFEVITWKACFHYIMSLGFLLIILSSILKYRNSGASKYFVLAVLSYGVSLFTLELSLIFPFIVMSMLLVISISKSERLLNKSFVATSLALVLVLSSYLILNKFSLGDWVGHYGAEQHLNFDLILISSHAVKYFFKYLFFGHFLPWDLKQQLYDLTNNTYILVLLVLLIILLPLFFLRRLLKKDLRYAQMLFSIIAFFLALAPILNLFFYKDNFNENDRYGYLASPFFYWLIVACINELSRLLKRSVIVIYLIISLFLFLPMRQKAMDAGQAFESLTNDFDFFDFNEVYILSIPENYAGFLMFRDWTKDGAGLKESLKFFREKEFENSMYGVTKFNMSNPDDRFEHSFADSTTVHLAIGQGGTWFWQDGKGAGNYSNDKYSFAIDGWYYKLKLKEIDPNHVFIYSDGSKWKSFSLQDYKSPN